MEKSALPDEVKIKTVIASIPIGIWGLAGIVPGSDQASL
jgi:hypothetical protein